MQSVREVHFLKCSKILPNKPLFQRSCPNIQMDAISPSPRHHHHHLKYSLEASRGNDVTVERTTLLQW
jgi:hypothetical protein